MLLFTNFLQQSLNELYAREQNKEYYILPTNINNSKNKNIDINEILTCLKEFLFKNNINISTSKKNKFLFNYFNIDYKSNKNDFLIDVYNKIISKLNPSDFHKESNKQNSITYIFVMKNLNQRFGQTIPFKNIYVKFSFSLKMINLHSISISNKNSTIVDLSKSFADLISIHF